MRRKPVVSEGAFTVYKEARCVATQASSLLMAMLESVGIGLVFSPEGSWCLVALWQTLVRMGRQKKK